MMREQLESDMKDAMRSGDTIKRDTLRLVLAAMKNARIEAGEDLDEDQEMAVLLSSVKSRRDSVEQYNNADRPDLADKELAEIDVIAQYLPRMYDEAETRKAVAEAIAETGASTKQELGKVMKAVMAAHKGKVDGKVVQRLTAEQLG